ncbi:MAG TPA: hypothetical protein VNF99_09155 [Stellaceae bacterium]|nr:hypothetical protein [Stellaceae bacterium]
MRGIVTTRRGWRSAVGLVLALAAINAGISQAGAGAARIAVAMPTPRYAISLGYPALVGIRHPIAMTARPWRMSREISNRRIVRPHIITVTPEGARSERIGFTIARPREERIAFGPNFPNDSQRRQGVIIVRGTRMSFLPNAP